MSVLELTWRFIFLVVSSALTRERLTVPYSGFLVNSSLGWRSNFWLVVIFGGLCFIAIVFGSPETYAPVLLRARAKKLAKQALHDGHGQVYFISTLDVGKPVQTVKTRFATSIFRPFELLFRETIVACFSIYMAYL